MVDILGRAKDKVKVAGAFSLREEAAALASNTNVVEDRTLPSLFVYLGNCDEETIRVVAVDPHQQRRGGRRRSRILARWTDSNTHRVLCSLDVLSRWSGRQG